MTRDRRVRTASSALWAAIGALLLAGAPASAAPNTGQYGLDGCDQFDANGQCNPYGGVGDGSSVRAPDPGVIGYDVVQPVVGDLLVDVSGGTAEIVYSNIDITFTVTFNVGTLTGFVDTDITSRIDGAVGNVVGDQIQWTGANEEFVSNGVIDCEIVLSGSPACTLLTDYVQGPNVFVEGRNVSKDGPGAADPTPIVLPDFDFSSDGSALHNTGEFNINKVGEADLFLALEATYLPEPNAALMLVPGALLLIALKRRRATQ